MKHELILGTPFTQSTTAWTSFIASICQGTMYCTQTLELIYIAVFSSDLNMSSADVLSELTVFGKTIDGGLVDTNIKFRALVWIGVLLWSAVAINFINRSSNS
jgi:hypothetical protein